MNRFSISRSRALWWILGVILGTLVGFVIYSFVGTFVFGVFIYYATRPVYRRLKRVIRPPSLAAATAIFTLALPALLLLAYTVAIGLQEMNKVLDRFSNTAPIETAIGPYLNISQVAVDPQAFLQQPNAVSAIQSIFSESMQYITLIGSGALHLFIMVAIAFYLLRDDRRLAAWGRDHFGDEEGVLVSYASAVDRDFSNIFFGNILNAFITALIGAISYNVIDVF
ncbi:MAG: AI-2E family transporter, partial [Halobacteriaceae archaeon]